MSKLKENLENKAIDDEKLEDVSGGRGYNSGFGAKTDFVMFARGTLLTTVYLNLNQKYGLSEDTINSAITRFGVPCYTDEAATSDSSNYKLLSKRTTFHLYKEDGGEWSIKLIIC